MEKIRNLPDEVYHKKIYDENFTKKNFILSYKGLMDIDLIKKDKKQYIEKSNAIHKVLSDIDFHKNLLFVCDKDIAKYVFLDGFLHFDKLKTYYYCDFMQLHDLYWLNGNEIVGKEYIDDSGNQLYSSQNISQDIFCLFIDREMYSPKTSDVLNSTITGRMNRGKRDGDSLYTWTFFRGVMSDLKDNKWFTDILRMYKSDKEKFAVIDLNNRSIGSIKTPRKRVRKNVSATNTNTDDRINNIDGINKKETEILKDIY